MSIWVLASAGGVTGAAAGAYAARPLVGRYARRGTVTAALSLLGAQSSLALRIRARLAAEADYRHGTDAAILTVLAEARAAEDPVALAEALSLAHH